MTPTFNRDRFRGALLGLAVGDAVGTTVEFKRPGSFAAVTDMVGGGPFGLEPGQWTDDTSMALCLAESLIERGGFDPTDQLERYVRWYRHGHFSSTGAMFDIGNATRASLERFERTSEPFPGSTDERTAGNGSIMRLAPVALFFARGSIAEVTEWAAKSSRTTHGATQAVDACRVLGALLAAAVCGASKQDLLEPDFWQWGDVDPAVAAVAAGSWRDKQPPAINGSGWCVESLEAALWALGTTESFESGCLAAVNLGDDADTTAAVYGQIAGAVYGELAIPAHWRRRLAHAALISSLTDQLWDAGQAAPTMPHHHVAPAGAPEAPLPGTFWIAPGELLAGNYPGSADKAEATAKLDALLAAGISAFVDLTEYGAAGFTAYEGLLAGRAAAAKSRVGYHRLPIVDVTAPTLRELGRVLAVIDAELAAGYPVYVHCRGGRGRTGVVAAAWLATRFGLNGDEALQRFQSLRVRLQTAHLAAPETEAQRAAVRAWADLLRADSDGA